MQLVLVTVVSFAPLDVCIYDKGGEVILTASTGIFDLRSIFRPRLLVRNLARGGWGFGAGSRYAACTKPPPTARKVAHQQPRVKNAL